MLLETHKDDHSTAARNWKGWIHEYQNNWNCLLNSQLKQFADFSWSCLFIRIYFANSISQQTNWIMIHVRIMWKIVFTIDLVLKQSIQQFWDWPEHGAAFHRSKASPPLPHHAVPFPAIHSERWTKAVRLCSDRALKSKTYPLLTHSWPSSLLDTSLRPNLPIRYNRPKRRIRSHSPFRNGMNRAFKSVRIKNVVTIQAKRTTAETCFQMERKYRYQCN